MTSRSLVTVVLASLSLIHPAAADPAIEPLVGFEVGPTPYGGAGTFPSRAALYKHTDGNFYSTLPGAGAFGAGALIQMKPTGEIGQLSFSTNLGSQPGANPVSTLCLSSDGWLWGTTPLGGVTNSYGTVFRMRPETGEFQTMHSFANGSGTRSRAGLVSDGQGYLWGTTYNSNANTGNGTIFRIHELTGVFETRLSFGGDIAPRGSQPTAALYYDGAGNLWGTTLYSGSGTGYPTVFKYNISSNTLITVGEFSGSSTVVNKIKGEGETSVLTSDGNGFLWGMTFLGGTSGYGTVFKVEMATNTTTSVLEFSNNAATNKGSYPVGSLVNDGAGFLWGVASNGGTGDEGTVFKIAHSTGVLTTVLQFGSLTGANVNVMRPVNGLTNDGNGYLWGLASYEFPGVPWAVYKIKMSDNSFTKVAEHQTGGVSYLGRTPLAGLAGSATSPWLWGTASVGGTNNLGTLFRYDPSTGQQQVITNFTGQTGTALGSKPNGKVHVDTSGVVWGTTEEGGTSNVGTIFKYDPATSTFSTVQSFSTGGGNRPKGALAGMSDGFIWGTASSGPSSSSGSVFKINPATSAVTVVHGFPSSISAEGYQLVCGLAEDSNGFVWGTAQAGGANGQGVIFKIEKNTGIFTVAASLTSGGGQAAGSLVVDASGNVWGSDSLRIFKFLPVTSALTYVFTAEAIAYPNKGVYRGTLSKTATGNIRFLGTETTQDYTTYLSPRAVIYEINASTNVVTKIRSLMEAGTGGSSPAELPAAGPLYEHTDGNLYGASSANGFTQDLSPAGGGMIYRVRTGPAVKTQAFSNTNALYYTAVTGTTATLRSMVNPNGNATTCVFEWGPTTAMGNTVTANAPVGSGFTSSLCQATLTGLPQNRTFFYRVRADSTGEPSLGDVMSFSTAAIATPPNAEISVESPIGQSLTDNVTTVNLGEHLVGRAYKQSVVVRNLSTGTGVGELNGLTAIVTGVNAGDFAITTPLTATILTPTVTSAGLLITFTASGSGARSALLTITSNDSDEANFEIPLTGEGLIQPEIEVDSTTAANLQSHEANYDFGSGTLNVGIARTFTIRNTGNAALSSLNVTVDGTNSSDFAVTTQPAASIADGSSGTFVVTFTPSAGGARSARLQIASNDSDENPFNINLSGTGIAAPEIEVADGATNLVSGNLPFINFGNVNTGTTLTKTITIRNVGNTLLHSISVTFFGTGSPTFQTSTVVVSIPAGQQTTFDLSFSPSVVGAYSTTMRIASNDSDENPFSTVVLGTGTVVSNSEIVVESPAGSSLTDAASTLDFSTVNTGATGTKTVVIRNTGTANLTSLALSFVGTNAAEFTASALSTTTLTTTAPSDSTGFTLTFTPTGSGTRTATMRIASNDGDENPFDITLTGTGHVPAGPVFTVQPQSQLVLLGQSANFTPTVTGDPVITYKWKKGTAFITNATASSYGIAITKAADAGAYSVIADNPVGAEVPSSPAYLGLVTLSQGTQILKAGTTLSLKCTVAAPTAPGVTLSYSWRRSGDPLSNETQADGSVVTGADKAALSITKLTTADAGNYTCLVTLNTPGNDPSTANGDTVVRVVDAVPDVDDLPPDSVSVSEPIDMTITATNFPTIFSATGLPAGMTFDTKTGRLKGKPTTPSKRNAGNTAYIPSKISFKATNPSGTSVAEDFYLTIEPLVPGVVGTFNGIVERSNHSNFGMGGHVKITVASTGVVSGDVTLAGQKHTIVGSINVSLGNNPTFDLIVKRAPATLGDLRLTGGISPPDNLLQGDISDPRFEMLTGTQDLGDRNEPGLINGTMEEARFNHPSGLALLANGSGYISDSGDHVIRFVDGDGGTVSTFAGNINSGSNNGTGTAASFAGPEGLALDIAGNLFVADTLNSTIRKITPAGVVTTFAGTAGQVGNVNGTGAAARFDRPCALCFDSTGNLYVADRGNHTIRKITQSGVVTTLAGKAGQSGHKDGSGTSALFDTPRGIVYEPVLKALFVTDSANVVIRKITLTGATTTYAGSPGAGGIADGLFANARFIDPRGITTLGDGTLIVTDTLLVQLNPNGTLGTVSDFLDTVGKLDHPVAVAYNPADESLITVDDVFHGAISYEPSGVNHEAHFAAQRNPWTTTNFVPPAEQGLYNAALETTALPMDGSFPQGDGYAQVAISKSGVATWTGKAADGTSFTFSTFIAGDRSIPLHAMMYKNTGSLQGECFLNATTLDLVSDVVPAFDWYKIPQPLASTDRSYKGGFLVHPLELSGGKYTPNNIYSFLGLTGAPANLTMDLSEAGLTSFTVPFTIATPNTVTVPANSSTATLKIDPKTGIYTGSFKSGSPAVTSSFTGVIIDYEAGNAKRGYGHFLLPASTAATAPLTSGRVRLEK